MSEPDAARVTPVPLATWVVVVGLVTLVVSGFVSVPLPIAVVGMGLAACGSAWLAIVLRRWQMGLAAVFMALRCFEPLLTHRAPPAGGTGTLVTLVAFAVLVLGGAWVGSRSANS